MSDQILKELAAEFVNTVKQPGDVSAQELADITGYSVTTCRAKLKEKVKAGELIAVEVRGRFGPEWVYRKVVQ